MNQQLLVLDPQIPNQFLVFKLLSYGFKKVGIAVIKVSFLRLPASCPTKPGDISFL